MRSYPKSQIKIWAGKYLPPRTCNLYYRSHPVGVADCEGKYVLLPVNNLDSTTSRKFDELSTRRTSVNLS